MNQIHLLIPNLLSPLKLWKQDFNFHAQSQIVSELLASSQQQQTSNYGLSNTLFSKLGYQEDEELPVAYYRYQADFGSPPDKPVMCADPINLQAGIDEIILSPEPITDLSNSDANELTEALNKHFVQDNWKFIVAESGNWYLKHQSDEVIHTTPLDCVRGKSIFKHLPKSNTLNWHSLQNEIQMLLHMTPLNQTREIAGQLPINSLWFWGAGNATAHTGTIDTLWGDGKDIRTASLASQTSYKALPKTYDALRQGTHIIVLDSLYYPAIQDQYSQWQQALQQLEMTVLKPLSKICKQKNIQLIMNTCDGQEFLIIHKNSWKFWKKNRVDLSRYSG